MDTWKDHLVSRLRKLNQRVDDARHEVLQKFKNSSTWAEVACANCDQKCFEADTLILPCKHAHCFDCIEDALERRLGQLDSAAQRNYKQLLKIKDWWDELSRVVICSTCRGVSAVVMKMAYSGRLDAKQQGCRSRKTYQVDADLTKELSASSEIHTHFENERRSLLGRFNERSLYSTFERPKISDDKGRLLDLSKINHDLEAMGGVWLDDWTIRKDARYPQGWTYAFNWLEDVRQYKAVPSAATFVRRRQMQRVSVKLRDKVRPVTAPPLRPLE